MLYLIGSNLPATGSLENVGRPRDRNQRPPRPRPPLRQQGFRQASWTLPTNIGPEAPTGGTNQPTPGGEGADVCSSPRSAGNEYNSP